MDSTFQFSKEANKIPNKISKKYHQHNLPLNDNEEKELQDIMPLDARRGFLKKIFMEKVRDLKSKKQEEI